MELQRETVRAGAAVRRHFTGGEWPHSEGGTTFPSVDPFPWKTVAQVAAGTRADAAARTVVTAADACPVESGSHPFPF